MFDKIKLRVEDLTQEQLVKASDRELHVLRLRFMGLWNKYLEKNEDVVVGSLNRNDILTKYRMLLKVMKGRSLEHSTEPIDRRTFKKAMEIKKVGIDIAQLKPILTEAAMVFLKADFAVDDSGAEGEEIEVIIKSDVDEPNETLEKTIADMLGQQFEKDYTFVYTTDFSGECIPLFDAVLRPVCKVEKIEMQKVKDSLKPGKPAFEKEISLIPLLKGTKKEERIVYGIVYEPDEEDSQGDVANAEEIRKAAYQFMEDCQTFKVMHKGSNVRVRILENYIAPVDFTIEKKSVKEGSWVLVTRILDPKIWKAIKKGKLTGYSMAGYARSD